MIYESNAEFIRSIQLPKEIAHHRYAVQTSFGNFIIIHKWSGEKGEIRRSDVLERDRKWIVSELTSDGQVVIRRFIPSNATQKLNFPTYLSLDSDDRVFISDDMNRRIILLDSDLAWNKVICPTHEENEKWMDFRPKRCCYDEAKQQLIVGASSQEDGINVYTFDRK